MSRADAGNQSAQGGRFDMRTLVGWILLAGLLSSLALLIAGTIWQYLSAGKLEAEFKLEGSDLYHYAVSIARSALAGHWRPQTLIALGICVLLLTPYVRVLVSMLSFLFAERNLKYTLFTLFVLCVLTYTLFLR
ncbi:MAG TPA: DUF1634 domain-containing protein [Gemmataceae bacterium]|nr:DUF1634 domain-containing protein [Gemmataceae bacterium]